VPDDQTYTAFLGTKLLASGPLAQLLPAVKARFDRDVSALILIFDDGSGRQVDFNLRGDLDKVLARALPAEARVGPGRPRLGVVSREVSLLPRHWEWLEEQPNGASAALRRLVEEARKREPGAQRARAAIQAAGRFLSAMAGDLPGYEEATRALYRRNRDQFENLIRGWPKDIRAHATRLLESSW
jgi:hypothetical protein